MNPAEEQVAIVDEHNRVIGAAPRNEMRRRRLIHRAAYVLVFDRQGRLFVQQRTTTKDIYPGWYDIAAGGVVLAGESYEAAARRELYEELGSSAPITTCFDHYHADADNRVWGRVFRCTDDGPFTLQAEEVAAGFFLEVPEILQRAACEPFTPDGIAILQRYQAECHGRDPLCGHLRLQSRR